MPQTRSSVKISRPSTTVSTPPSKRQKKSPKNSKSPKSPRMDIDSGIEATPSEELLRSTMKSFLNPKILGLIADNTNLMAEAKKAKKWKKVTAQEILLWIGLILYMSRIEGHRIEEFWSEDRMSPQHPIRKYMTYKRFDEIRQNFHIGSPDLPDPVPDYEEFWERVDNMGWIDRSEVAPDTDEPWEDEEEVDLWFQHVAPLVDSIRSTATSHCVPCPKIDIIDDDRMTMKKYKGPRFDEWDAPVIYNRRPRRRNDFFTEFELSHAWYRLFFYCLDAVLECSRLIYKDHPKMKKLVDDEYDFPLDCAWECILDGSGEGITATELRARVTVEKGEELPPLRFDTSVPHMPKFMDIAKECYLCKWELVNEHEGAPSETPRGKIECEDCMYTLCLTEERNCFRKFHVGDHYDDDDNDGFSDVSSGSYVFVNSDMHD